MNTTQALYGVVHNIKPLVDLPYTHYALQQLWFNELQDAMAPGQRQKNLQKLQENQGVTPF